MSGNLKSRLAKLERTILPPPGPIRLLRGEWPFVCGWYPGEAGPRRRADRRFDPSFGQAEFRWAMNEQARLAGLRTLFNAPAEATERVVATPRGRVVRAVAWLLLWCPETEAQSGAAVLRAIAEHPDPRGLPCPVPCDAILRAYIRTRPERRLKEAQRARAESVEMPPIVFVDLGRMRNQISRPNMT